MENGPFLRLFVHVARTTDGQKCGRQQSMPNLPNLSDFLKYFCGTMVYGSMLMFCGFYLIQKVPEFTENLSSSKRGARTMD
jgi:hypothetical protein